MFLQKTHLTVWNWYHMIYKQLPFWPKLVDFLWQMIQIPFGWRQDFVHGQESQTLLHQCKHVHYICASTLLHFDSNVPSTALPCCMHLQPHTLKWHVQFASILAIETENLTLTSLPLSKFSNRNIEPISAKEVGRDRKSHMSRWWPTKFSCVWWEKV